MFCKWSLVFLIDVENKVIILGNGIYRYVINLLKKMKELYIEL